MTEVKVPAKRDYIGHGGFGDVFKGKLCGEIVALKVLYRTGDNVIVSPFCPCTSVSVMVIRIIDVLLIGVLSGGIDVGDAQA